MLDYPLEVVVEAVDGGEAGGQQHLRNWLREDAVYSLFCYQKPIGTRVFFYNTFFGAVFILLGEMQFTGSFVEKPMGMLQ